ncbi:PP2C family protein-serine/threonine phosphatase [Streptomyces fuscigenes]|uniref:PP2C family protein-serine/threonine phosphatase n=1 Tax=Streptomyces fuscigenes TaxID=1528880 RepID=UPI001F3F331E|nr:PP2C family protein-serine/threonine phosphatase [Streptomyces fuscigenes]MCF3963333.1 serine/threonine-protein phosphatase [Streptomyces fuscigenes]
MTAGEGRGSGGGERLLDEMLAAAHQAAPMDLPVLVGQLAGIVGVDRLDVYLVDLQQRYLVPLAPPVTGPPALDIDSTTAGRAYRTLGLVIDETLADHLAAWLPLVDGAERLGVLGVSAVRVDTEVLRRCRIVASLLSMVITSKRAYSDSFARHTRLQPMRLPAELLRAFLPPRTIANRHATSTAVLEPAYQLGGDAFDHSLTGSSLHATIFDAMGHNLASGLTTAVAMAACRNTRRAEADLPEMVRSIDRALARWLPEQYCTGILARLDTDEGILRWCNCGHPPPLLIRDERVLEGALERPAEPPMGMPAEMCESTRTLHEERLLPGDRVLLYTDGVTESRIVGDVEFGLKRFTDSIIRATAAGTVPAEALRQLIHSLLDHQEDALRDDATLLLLEWRPPVL